MKREDIDFILLSVVVVSVFVALCLSGCAAKRVASHNETEEERVTVSKMEIVGCKDTVEYNERELLTKWKELERDVVTERMDTMGRVVERTTVRERAREREEASSDTDYREMFRTDRIECWGGEREAVMVSEGSEEKERGGWGMGWWWLLLWVVVVVVVVCGVWWRRRRRT